MCEPPTEDEIIEAIGYLLLLLLNKSTIFLSLMEWLLIIPVLVRFVSAPLSGWLADAKFGNYKMFRVGAVLLFIATVLNCLFLIMEELLWESNDNAILKLKWVHFLLSSYFIAVGSCACMVIVLPHGLDHMPDASSSSIASYIVWFNSSIFCGGLIAQGFYQLRENCIHEEMQSAYTLVWAL